MKTLVVLEYPMQYINKDFKNASPTILEPDRLWFFILYFSWKCSFHNEGLTVLFTKVKFIQLNLNSRLTPPTCFRFNFEEKFKPLRFAKDLEFFLLFACISQNSLTSDNFWRNKICILLHLDIVHLTTKTVLEHFISSFLTWFSCRHILNTPFSVKSKFHSILNLKRACGKVFTAVLIFYLKTWRHVLQYRCYWTWSIWKMLQMHDINLLL